MRCKNSGNVFLNHNLLRYNTYRDIATDTLYVDKDTDTFFYIICIGLCFVLFWLFNAIMKYVLIEFILVDSRLLRKCAKFIYKSTFFRRFHARILPTLSRSLLKIQCVSIVTSC